MQLKAFAVIGLWVVLAHALYAQTPAEAPAAATAGPPAEVSTTEAEPAPEPTLQERLEGILEAIKAAEAERDQLRKRLKATTVEAEAKDLNEDIKRLTRRLEELRRNFEETATGGATVKGLEANVEQQPIDWKEEVEDVVRPLLEEIKRITERPRTLERLRTERALYERRVETADRAIARIEQTLETTEARGLRKAMEALLEEWQSHRADADSRLQLVSGQLERLLAPEEEPGAGIIEAVREFLAGRGLSILLAIAGFVLAYLVLAGLGRLAGRVWRRRHEARARALAKASGILFRIVSVALALFVAMAVLYVRGDWFILGLLILLLFALVLALRNSLPRYLDETRLLLNMGGVREGERIVHNGIPWRIKSLNFYSILHNPLLRGGTIRVPIGEMATLTSRQYTAEEPWFPSREGDFVILDGDVFGKVLLQTPEIVQLQVIGSTKTFAVGDYLAQHPRNLSLDGFAIPVTVGLDYRHQGEILTTIVAQMRAHLQARLAEQAFRGHMTDLIVDFNEAAGSSLNLIVVGVFGGGAAGDYWSIRRFLQRAAVEACNRYAWSIPFDQLTVHLQGSGEARADGS